MKKKFIFLMLLFALLGGVSVNSLGAQQQYRVKFTTLNYYLEIFDNTSHPSGPTGGVGVSAYSESNSQIFTIEDGSNGGVYLKSADGYYIYCNGGWNVDAINGTDKTELYGFNLNGGTFNIYDDDGYFKVQNVNNGYYVFHNANFSLAALWQLEEVQSSGGDTGDEPSGDVCTLELSLKDSYGDGWTGNKIVVANGSTSKEFTISNGVSAQHTCDVISGTNVTLSFVCGPNGSYSYPTECSWTIKYQDGDDIWSGTGSVAGSSHTFTASCEAAVMPEIPTSLVATAESHKVISLSWDEAENAKKYNVYQDGVKIAEEITETSYVVKGLTQLTEYCFTVTAINGANETEPSDEVCVTTPERVILPGPQEQEIGEGSTEGNSYLPAYTYYAHSYSQQIYTKAEIDFVPGEVTKIAFKQKNATTTTRNYKVYLVNTDKETFNSGSDWVAVTDNDLYFDGQVTYPGSDQWLVITLTKSFQYEGNNILVAVDDDLTSGYPQTQFYAYPTTDRSISVYNDNTNYSINNTGTGSFRDYNNQVIFTIEISTPSVTPSVESIALGEVRMGNYWSERPQVSETVSVEFKNTNVTEITCDNDFFTLSGIDYNANPIVFNVSYDKSARKTGEQTGNITIAYADTTAIIPVTATAYTPARGDIYESPTTITFSNGTYTHDATGMHDDYILPEEENDGNNGDAVYKFTLNETSIVTANVEGTNGIVAIYNANDLTGSGPSSNNNSEGVVPDVKPAAPTSFFYNFDDSSLDAFNLIDEDGDGRNWFVADGEGSDGTACIKSYSYENAAYNANNIIITKVKYELTETSKLTFGAAFNQWAASYPQYRDAVKVEVSSNGADFTRLADFTPTSYAFQNFEVDFGTVLAANGLGYGEYYIALRHQDNDKYDIRVDNLQLSDGSAKTRHRASQIDAVQYEPGTYYLVAAAEGDFTVTVETGALPSPNAVTYIAPENNAMEQENPKLKWKFGKYTTEYRLLLGTSSTLGDEHVVVDWTTELAETFDTKDLGLQNNNKYYWRVDAKNSVGTTQGDVYSFVTPLDTPQYVYANPQIIYEGDTTEIIWDVTPIEEGFLYYNLYLNDNLWSSNIQDTYYQLVGLEKNLNGHKIGVSAVYEIGESQQVTSYVYVAGKTTYTINVTDNNGTPLADANISLRYGYDELGYEIESYNFTTDENGQVIANVKTLGSGSYYEVSVSKTLYESTTDYLYNYSSVTKDYVLNFVAPYGLTSTPEGIYPGESVTMTWNPIDGVENQTYNIYVNGVKHNTEAIADTAYVISDLQFISRTTPNEISVQVVHELGTSALSTPVYVTVAGTFTLEFHVVNNDDETLAQPIAGAAVRIGNSGFKDDIGNDVTVYEITTDENGYASQVVPLFPADGSYAYYQFTITKGLYSEFTNYYTNYGYPANGDVKEITAVMTLPGPNNAGVDKDYYFVGEDVQLSWTAPELPTRALIGYNVYEITYDYNTYVQVDEKLNEEIVTGTTYTVSGLGYGNHTLAVSAVYDEGESSMTSTYASVIDYGAISGVVKDSEGKAIKGAEVEISGYDFYGNERAYYFTSDRYGKFSGEEIMLSYDYTVRASKFDFIDYESLNSLAVEYGVTAEVEIIMESNPVVDFTVEAADNDTVSSISWGAPLGAGSYKLYREDVANEGITVLADSIIENNFVDYEWSTLADAEYRYGVSAYMEKSFGFKESFANGIPADWKTYRSGSANSYYDAWIWKQASETKDGISAYDGDYGIAISDNNKGTGSNIRMMYMVTSLIDLTEAVNPKISFVYHTPYFGASYTSESYTNELKVLVLTEAQGQDAGASGAQLWTNNSAYTTWWTTAEVDLSAYQGQKIYIAFESNPKYGNGSSIDYVEITADPTYYTSRINWSDPLVKGAIVYRGEGDWTTATNWSTGEVPSSTDDVTIKGKVTVTGNVEINSITIAKNSSMGMGYGEGEEYSLTLASGSVLTVTNGINNNNYSSSFIINDGAQVYQNYEGVEATFNMLIQNPTDWKDTLNKDGWQMIASPLKGSSVNSFVPADTDYDLYKYDGAKELQWVNHKYHANSGGSFNYNFENSVIPNEITQIDSDGDGKKWGVVGDYNNNYTYTQNIVGSHACLYSESYYATANTDNYLVLPKSFIVEGSVLSFQITNYFSYYSYGYSEQYQVLVSETTPEIAEFEPITDVLTTATSNNSSGEFVWENKEYDLSAYKGKEIYIAIRHINNNDTGKSALVLDNIKLVRGEFDEFELEFVQGRAYLASYEWEDAATFMGKLNHEMEFGFKQVSYDAGNEYANFHLIGNPFTFNMDWNKMAIEGVYDGFATVNKEGTYNYHTEGTIAVGDGFFVKTIGENPSMRYDATAKRRATRSSHINLIASGNSGQDNVIIKLAGEESEGFMKLDNFNEDAAEIYVVNNGRRYGIMNYAENVEEVEVKFAAKQMGNYTINAIPEGGFSNVTLIDRQTGVETNLLLENYTFTATSKDARDRFVVRFSQGGANDGDDFVYQSGDELIINGAGTIQIIDVMGRIVYSSDVESCNNRINVSGLKKAAYMVRNIKGNEIKTQKIVVL